MDCEGGNPVSAPGVGGKVPLVTVSHVILIVAFSKIVTINLHFVDINNL